MSSRLREMATTPARPEIDNPFPVSAQLAPETRVMVNTDQQRAVAEVSAAMAIARQNPRNPVQAMDRILNACTRPTLAEQAVYQYARGGSDITGPSIRLAEVLAQNWGNCQFGIRELDQRGGESTVQAFCWDVETNVRREVTFTVRHARYTKQGSKVLEDPRDIYEMVANQGARRLRACILAIIPGDVTEAAVKQCEVTMASKADVTPDGIRKLVEAFSAYGVTRAQIEARIQRHVEAIQPAQVIALKKIYTSMRDGMSKPADWFDTPLAAAVAPIDGAPEAEPKQNELPPVDKSLEGYLNDIAAAEDSAALDMIEKDAEGEFEGSKLKIVKDAVAGRRQALAG